MDVIIQYPPPTGMVVEVVDVVVEVVVEVVGVEVDVVVDVVGEEVVVEVLVLVLVVEVVVVVELVVDVVVVVVVGVHSYPMIPSKSYASVASLNPVWFVASSSFRNLADERPPKSTCPSRQTVPAYVHESGAPSLEAYTLVFSG